MPKELENFCILKRYIGGKFIDDVFQTIIEFGSQSIIIEGIDCIYQIFDSSGKSPCRFVVQSFYRSAQKDSLTSAGEFFDELRRFSKGSRASVLLGNKSDIYDGYCNDNWGSSQNIAAFEVQYNTKYTKFTFNV